MPMPAAGCTSSPPTAGSRWPRCSADSPPPRSPGATPPGCSPRSARGACSARPPPCSRARTARPGSVTPARRSGARRGSPPTRPGAPPPTRPRRCDRGADRLAAIGRRARDPPRRSAPGRSQVPYPRRVSYARSWLYVPGNRRDFLDAALRRGADALIIDLEDSVPAAAKETARAAVSAWLPGRPPPGAELWLRINGDAATADLGLVTAAVTGVVVPKAEPGLLGRRERELGLPAGRFALVPLIETARGLLSAERLAGMPRVTHLGLGEADLCAELRLRPSGAAAELAPLRLQVVLASAAAGIGAPVAPTSRDYRDLRALRASTEGLLRGGFRARTAIHPAQVPVINEVFSPSPAEVAEARRLVGAFERSPSGVITDDGGQMVDAAVVRSAREVLARAERGTQRDPAAGGSRG